MKQKLVIGHRLPGLNEIIGEANNNRYGGNKFKKQWQEIICQYIKKSRLKPMVNAKFVFLWLEPNKKRDKDNIAAGGRKYIFDSLVEMGILKGDGWNFVINWEDHFGTDHKKEGVIVLMEEVFPPSIVEKILPDVDDLIKHGIGYEPKDEDLDVEEDL